MLRSVEGSDASVQGTNDDAQISKLSCAKAGYFRDEFIQYFVRRASRRSPLINRGYYSRHAALRQLLESFLVAAEASGRQPQVLVLGAGFDTTWFQLCRDKGRVPYKCLEVDFKEVTQRKAAIISKEPALLSLLAQQHLQPHPQQPPHEHQQQQQQQGGGGTSLSASQARDANRAGTVASAAQSSAVTAAPAGAEAAAGRSAPGGSSAALPAGLASASAGAGSGAAPPGAAAGAGAAAVHLDAARGEMVSAAYSLLPADLRDLGGLEAAVRRAGFDPRAPTYILSECVLVYMEPAHSAAVLRWAATTFPNAVVAIYEQIRPDDAFGRQMVSNLEMRGCPLRGLPATPTLQAHIARLTDAGWSWADARDMDTLYRSFVDPAERVRTERLELFDELEEWHLIQEHYCIGLGRNDADGWLTAFKGFGAGVMLPPPPPPPALGRRPPGAVLPR